MFVALFLPVNPFGLRNLPFAFTVSTRDGFDLLLNQKRLEGLTEAELEALLEQVEEEKRQLARGEQVSAKGEI